jgi:hypothetical protein
MNSMSEIENDSISVSFISDLKSYEPETTFGEIQQSKQR